MGKCTENSGEKCLFATSEKCVCECNGDNHGKQISLLVMLEERRDTEMTINMKKENEAVFRRAMSQLAMDFSEAIEKRKEYPIDQFVQETIDLIKQFEK